MLDTSLLRGRGDRLVPVAFLSSKAGGAADDESVTFVGRAQVGNTGRREEDGTRHPVVLLRVGPEVA